MPVQIDPNERLLKILQAPREKQEAIDRILYGLEPVVSEETGPLLFSMGMAAKFLGLSRSTLWRLIRAGRLDKVEVLPGSFRIRRSDLVAIVAKKGGDHVR